MAAIAKKSCVDKKLIRSHARIMTTITIIIISVITKMKNSNSNKSNN